MNEIQKEPHHSKPKETSATPLIVGIGASAGGLKAIELFLENVPALSGLAFVIVQHLDPSHEDTLVELLQRITPMKVVQARNHMRVAPDHVYVIPPNKDMSVLHGAIYLLEQAPTKGMRLPIDYFFRTLADDQHERAIGVVLSGLGSDGTLGLRAIKEKGGLALVQEPDSADFDSMPRTAITTVVVDIVAPPDELPARLLAYLKSTPIVPRQEKMLEIRSQSALDKITVILRERTGNDFSLYKKSSMYRRIERRMGLHQIDHIANYLRYLRETPQEQDLLFKELLIGVTNFFRDRPVWEYLHHEGIPSLLKQYPYGKHLRAWVPACSTGEEAYSLAIVFREVVEQLQLNVQFSLQIFATDLDQDAIEKARQGLYPSGIGANISDERLKRFFTPEGSGYRINKEIREKIIFAQQNLVMDPPFTKLDIISCRNLLIYLGPELQQKLFPLFYYALNPDGLLLLGNSETVSSSSNLFTPVDNKSRLFRRADTPLEKKDIFPMTPIATAAPKKPAPPVGNMQILTDQLLLQQFTPPAVLVNKDGDILYINGHTGKYLEPAAGKANWNIHAMAREELRHELLLALKRALRQSGPVKVNGIKLTTGGIPSMLSLTVQAIDKPSALQGLIIVVFSENPATSDAAAPHWLHPGQHSLMEELQQAHKELQSTREEMQTSQEEFKSTYEELQAINEELQTTNEELTTSKEEIQSINEEFQTINKELQSKVNDLSLVNNDLNNLVAGSDLIAIFLDSALHVRRFTPSATGLFKLIPSDIGRPLTDVVTVLDYPELRQDVENVLRTLVFVIKEINSIHHHRYKVRVQPYRTQNDVIDGVLVIFTDITDYLST